MVARGRDPLGCRPSPENAVRIRGSSITIPRSADHLRVIGDPEPRGTHRARQRQEKKQENDDDDGESLGSGSDRFKIGTLIGEGSES